MNKKNICLTGISAFSVIMGFIFVSCSHAQKLETGFGIYLVENGELILSDEHIKSYEKGTHEIELNEKGIKKWESYIVYDKSFNPPIPKLTGLYKKEFMVKVNGKEMYRGKFWSELSSLGYSGVVILEVLGPKSGKLKIDWGYPGRIISDKAPDPRDKQEIFTFFEKKGILLSTKRAIEKEFNHGVDEPVRIVGYNNMHLAAVKVLPICINGKYGYVDGIGVLAINPQFDCAEPFSNGLAAVRIEDKWGFINRAGTFVIEPGYGAGYSFSNGLSIGNSNEKFVYIDTTGKKVIDAEFRYAKPFSEGLAAVSIGSSPKYGYIDKTGKTVIEPQFDQADLFSEGLACIKGSPAYGYIDKSGKIVIGCQFDQAGAFSMGLAPVRIKGKCGYIDKSGRIVIKPQYDDARGFKEGFACVRKGGGTGGRIGPDAKWGFIDRTGKIVIDFGRFDSAESFSEGLALVSIDSKYGYIDRSGRMVIEPKFVFARSFSDGIALVMIKGSERTYINKGVTLYDSWRCTYIDKTGKFLFEPL